MRRLQIKAFSGYNIVPLHLVIAIELLQDVGMLEELVDNPADAPEVDSHIIPRANHHLRCAPETVARWALVVGGVVLQEDLFMVLLRKYLFPEVKELVQVVQLQVTVSDPLFVHVQQGRNQLLDVRLDGHLFSR